MPNHLFMQLFIISLISTTNFTHAYQQCLHDEKTLLLKLKNNLTFDSSVSRKLVQWDGTKEDCCNWEGVECDAAGHVINLQLDFETLSGTIHNSSTTLSSLLYLQKLNLAYNSLSGSIPPSLFLLPSLHQLKLSNNNFTGQVQEFLSPTLSQISKLDLSSNRLEGPIPDSFLKLKSLQLLSLSNNFFNGTFHLDNIRKLQNLTTLNLSYNNLSVDASSTNSSSSKFPQLYQLSLVSCNLSSFPDLRNQSQLRFLDLSNNRIRGEIPNWIWEIGSGEFWQLNVSYNHLVDLQKPYKIPNSLQVLDLHSNQLRGELPLPQERALYVDYSNNKFDKPIPINIGNYLSYLIFFSVSNNSLSGTIPTSLCDATYLQVLDLSFNNLSGSIPPCLLQNTQNLGVFNLRRNNISGEIPDRFSENCGLETLDLSGNSLLGKIPKSLENCSSLTVLNVDQNSIQDGFPCMLPSSLRVLVLSSNRFHGEIRCDKEWPDLQIIDISSNSFTGSLDQVGFSRCKRMVLDSDGQSRREQLYFTFLNLKNSYYQDEVTLTIKGSNLKLPKIWSDYTAIDFSCNKFHGQIPEAIGYLSSLHLLNLSHNTLKGRIPTSFGNMVNLEALDLSVNQLREKIPVELAQLRSLEILNLSYNMLAGRIPYGPQLSTIDSSSYEGNAGLCGFPLDISCNYDKKLENVESHVKSEMGWNYISAEVGYAVGLGSTIWLLVFCRRLRESYFGKVDEVLENIYERQRRKRSLARRRRRATMNQVRRQ